MVDRISVKVRSANMRAIKSKDTRPEMTVRRLLYSMGYRYRIHRKDLPGNPDIAFASRKKVILVHGCFWHQHGDPECPLVNTPKSNSDYWTEKLSKNCQRDFENRKMLTDLGWSSLVVWECQTLETINLESVLRQYLEDGE